MKKLFNDYSLSLSKGDRKILTTMVKQLLKQISGNTSFEHVKAEKAFQSVLTKLESGEETIKLTKDEFQKLRSNVEGNVKHLRIQSQKGWFLKKWMYRSMLTQYEILYENNFKS